MTFEKTLSCSFRITQPLRSTYRLLVIIMNYSNYSLSSFSLLSFGCTPFLSILDLWHPTNYGRQEIRNFAWRTCLCLHSTLRRCRLHFLGHSQFGTSLSGQMLWNKVTTMTKCIQKPILSDKFYGVWFTYNLILRIKNTLIIPI